MASLVAPPPPDVSQLIVYAAGNGSSFQEISQVAVAGVFVLIFILAAVILIRTIRLRLARQRQHDLMDMNLALFQNTGVRNSAAVGLNDAAMEALGRTFLFTSEMEEGAGTEAGAGAGPDLEAGELENTGLKECAVCLEDYKSGQSCRTLNKCGHTFHQTCIGAWAKGHASCPLCRVSLLPEPKVDEPESSQSLPVTESPLQPTPAHNTEAGVGAPVNPG